MSESSAMLLRIPEVANGNAVSPLVIDKGLIIPILLQFEDAFKVMWKAENLLNSCGRAS